MAIAYEIHIKLNKGKFSGYNTAEERDADFLIIKQMLEERFSSPSDYKLERIDVVMAQVIEDPAHTFEYDYVREVA